MKIYEEGVSSSMRMEMTERQTDGHDDANSLFHSFVNAPKI